MRKEFSLGDRVKDVKELWVGEPRQKYLQFKKRLIAIIYWHWLNSCINLAQYLE
jgi:hypothetical protein